MRSTNQGLEHLSQRAFATAAWTLNVETALIAEWLTSILEANGPPDRSTQKVNRTMIWRTISVLEGFL